MRITALQPQKHHPERVNVFVDGAFRLGLAVEVASGAGLCVGAEVDEELLAAVERRDLAWKAREAALQLLAYRSRTEAELRRRLLHKEFPADVVDACVGDLAERGFVDDGEFAAAFVRDRVRSRPRGGRRLVQELRARGVDREMAEETVERALRQEDVTEDSLAREAAEAWARRALAGRSLGGPHGDDARRARRRLYGYLARRGFAPDAIRAAMDAVLAGASD
ncbi:MAG TPA: RecX family transcriptional regulator [Longimicrobiales bacterium]